MQTFLPFADFDVSAASLDDRRLGKQRVETLQILRALVYPSYRGWKNHPATRMWRGFTAALVAYGLAVCAEWRRRGGADTVADSLLQFSGGGAPDVERLWLTGRLPPWLGRRDFHEAHRSVLVEKLPEHYASLFPDAPRGLPCLWPESVFPRWPIRRGSSPLTFDEALAMLGWSDPRPGQREAVAALVDGDDVSLTWHPGTGARSVGVLAGMCLPGTVLWVHDPGEQDLDPPPVDELRPPPRPTGSRSQRTGRPATSIARAPTADDLASVRAEATLDPVFRFFTPALLDERRVRRGLRDVSLVVAEVTTHLPRVSRAATLTIGVDRRPPAPQAASSRAG